MAYNYNWYEKSLLHMEPRYVNPFTDFGFKKLFGEEPNKELLLDFLNELLSDREGRIVEINYLQNEHLDGSATDRKAVFDLYCQNERGEKFIVELQKAKQRFFKDRTLYYTTFPIREQAKVSDWNYELKSIYMIAILDFTFDDSVHRPDKYRHDIQLIDKETHDVFYDKLTFIYLEMPKFTKSINELETRFDKWLYAIRNLSKLEEMPTSLQERIFSRLFEAAEVAKFDPVQRLDYNASLKYYRDLKNSFDTARYEGREIGFEEGRAEGRAEGREEGREEGLEKGRKSAQKEAVLSGHKLGLAVEVLAKVNHLTVAEVRAILAADERR